MENGSWRRSAPTEAIVDGVASPDDLAPDLNRFDHRRSHREHLVIGPVALLVGGGVFGALYGGLAGAIIGLSMGGMAVAGIVVLASAWAQRVAPHLEPEIAWAEAPRPPGFAGLCDWVYERQMPSD